MSDSSSWFEFFDSSIAWIWEHAKSVLVWITNNPDVITAVSTTLLAIIAWQGISTWREQLPETTKHKIATDILEAVLIYRNSLKRVRAFDINKSEAMELNYNYESLDNETPSEHARLLDKHMKKFGEMMREQDPIRKEELKKDLTAIEGEKEKERFRYHARTKPLIYEVRLQRAGEAYRKIEDSLVKGEVSIGNDVEGLVDELYSLHGQLVQAFYVYREKLRILAYPSFHEETDEKLLRNIGADDAGARDWKFEKRIEDGADKFDEQLDRAVDVIKQKLRTYIDAGT